MHQQPKKFLGKLMSILKMCVMYVLGLNIISEFNLENVTEYSTTSFEKMDVQEDVEAEVNNK